jgi:hypothetical protein
MGQRNDSSGLGSAMPDPRGDIPRPIRRTYETHSTSLPKTTQSVIVRQLTESGITASGASAVTGQYNFTLAALDGATSLAIWDQYRILAIRFTMIPTQPFITLQPTASVSTAPLYCVIDYDDSTALASQAAARKYDNCIIADPGESLCRVFKPRAAIAAYAGAFTNFANVPSPWIDTVSAGVQHYGIKVYIPSVTAAQTVLQSWDIQVEHFIEFRSLIQ